MAELTYEIAYWQASDALKNDLSVCKPVIEVIKRHTPHPVYAGISVESAKFFIVVTWDNTEAHNKFIAHSDYQSIQVDFAPLFPEDGAAGSTALHTHFDADPLSIFSAPVVEHVFMTPQDDVSLDELRNVMVRAHARLEGYKESFGSVIGTIEERPDQLVVVAGWESIEAHQRFNAPGGPVGDDIFPEILSKVKTDVAVVEHVTYNRLA